MKPYQPLACRGLVTGSCDNEDVQLVSLTRAGQVMRPLCHRCRASLEAMGGSVYLMAVPEPSRLGRGVVSAVVIEGGVLALVGIFLWLALAVGART